LALFVSRRYASGARLWKEETTAETLAAAERRIVVAQSLYAFGTLLCVINTYWSIAVIVLAQLNYAIAPRILALYRL